jgi:Flp pilus assembly protein TadD
METKETASRELAKACEAFDKIAKGTALHAQTLCLIGEARNAIRRGSFQTAFKLARRAQG